MKGEDLFLGLNYVNSKFIEEAETVTQLQEKRKVLSLRRPVLIAAIVAMLLMLVGCAVVYVLNMQKIHIGQQQTRQDRDFLYALVIHDVPNIGKCLVYINCGHCGFRS